MPLHRADALILKTYKLGESDRIVVFLTRDRGKKRGVARGARRPRSRFVGALEPMTLARVTYFERETRELVAIDEVDVARSPLEMGRDGDLDLLGHVEYFAELIDEWAPEADPNERLYRLGAALIDALATGVPIDALARYFEYWLLRLQGVYPSAVACQGCGAPLAAAYLRPGDAVFVCEACAGEAQSRAHRLSAEAVSFLRLAATLAPDQLGDMTLGTEAGRELEAVHRALIARHLDREPRSVRVLKQLV